MIAVKQILNRKYSPSNQPKLTQEQIQRIEESKQQIKQGEFLTNEQTNKLVDEWLNEP